MAGKMRRPLDKNFFGRRPLLVARDLIGKHLVRRYRRKTQAFMITETEAYAGKGDMSSHAAKGPTKRNQAMFGPPGRWYVYFIYGMYHCLNVVTGKDGEASAVLIRGVQGADGPGKVCRELKINLLLYGKPANSASGLWIEDRGDTLKSNGYKVRKMPRVNVGGDEKAKKRLWRFVIKRS